MDEKLAQQILDELFEHLEDVETQSAAILQFLKAKGLATDKELAPHFEQAAKATGVRWVAERARIHYLLSSAANSPERVTERQSDSTPETAPGKDEKEVQVADQSAGNAKTEEAVTASTD
jgi:hypothetical protein